MFIFPTKKWICLWLFIQHIKGRQICSKNSFECHFTNLTVKNEITDFEIEIEIEIEGDAN